MKKRSPRKIQSDAEPAYQPFLPKSLAGDDDTVRLNPLEGILQLFTSGPLKSRSMYFRTHVTSVWHHAHRYLLHDPPRGKTILSHKDLDDAIYAETDEGLSVAQANALSVLRCIRELTEMLDKGKPVYAEGRLNPHPIEYKGSEAERDRAKQQIDALTPDQYFEGLREPLARMCGYVMELTQAAMNLGFYGLLWDTVSHGKKMSGGEKRRKGQHARDILNEEVLHLLSVHGINSTPREIWAALQTGRGGIEKIDHRTLIRRKRNKKPETLTFKKFKGRFYGLKFSIRTNNSLD